jgi:hypothetical protein
MKMYSALQFLVLGQMTSLCDSNHLSKGLDSCTGYYYLIHLLNEFALPAHFLTFQIMFYQCANNDQ